MAMRTLIFICCTFIYSNQIYSQLCEEYIQVTSQQKISDTDGDFQGTLSNEDLFGRSVCEIGDLNGDGVTDIAVGAEWDDDGGTRKGAVWILFLNSDGTVDSFQKISETFQDFQKHFRNSPNFSKIFRCE